MRRLFALALPALCAGLALAQVPSFPIVGAGGGVGPANQSGTFTAATSVTITHNLNTLDVIWKCSTAAGADIPVTSISGQTLNAITLNFSSATGKCVVNGTGGVGATGATGATGAAGPAVAGTGLVEVNGGVAGLATADVDYVAPATYVSGLAGKQDLHANLTAIAGMAVTNGLIPMANGTAYVAVSLVDCSNATTGKLLFTLATRTFTCGTDQNTGLGGGGDASTNTSTSVDGEIALFHQNTGKIVRRATLTGMLKATGGVLAQAIADTDYVIPATLTSGLALKANVNNPTFTGTVGGITAAMVGAAATSHNHASADVNSGTMATARLGSGTANSTTFLRGDQTWATPGGSGTVTVVSSGSLTSTALVTGGGTTTLQTPAATATMDSSGNISTPGTISSGVGGSDAGTIEIEQGTAPALGGAGTVRIYGDTAITAYKLRVPSASSTGFLLGTDTSNDNVMTFVGFTGTGNVMRATAPTASGSITVNSTGAGFALKTVTHASTVATDPYLAVYAPDGTTVLGGLYGTGFFRMPAVTLGSAVFDSQGYLGKATGTGTNCLLVSGSNKNCYAAGENASFGSLTGTSITLPNSTSLPGTCTVGQIYMDTDATTGQRIYACESTNTWTLQGGSGGGGAAAAPHSVTMSGSIVTTTYNATPGAGTHQITGPVGVTCKDGSGVYTVNPYTLTASGSNFNVAIGAMTGVCYIAALGSGVGDMQKSENLSGLANTTTARTNLGAAAATHTHVQTLVGWSYEGVAAPATGRQGACQTIPAASTITGWAITAEPSGSAVFDIWKNGSGTGTLPVIGGTITASAKPTISAANKAASTTLTGWTTSITAGDTICLNLDSVSTATKLSLVVYGTR